MNWPRAVRSLFDALTSRTGRGRGQSAHVLVPEPPAGPARMSPQVSGPGDERLRDLEARLGAERERRRGLEARLDAIERRPIPAPPSPERDGEVPIEAAGDTAASQAPPGDAVLRAWLEGAGYEGIYLVAVGDGTIYRVEARRRGATYVGRGRVTTEGHASVQWRASSFRAFP